jgi:hypothetical protein
MTTPAQPFPSPDEHHKAFTEVAFLLDMFAATIDNVMGGATASVGRIAGRGTASKWPVDLDHPTLGETLDVVSRKLNTGFEISCSEHQNTVDMTVRRCVIREVCRQRQLKPGCPLCKLFHSYLDGIVNEIVGRPVKSELIDTSDECTLCMKVQ